MPCCSEGWKRQPEILISVLVDPLSSLALADSAALYLAIDSGHFIKSTILWWYLVTSPGKEIENWLFPEKYCLLFCGVLSEHEKLPKEKGGRRAPCVCRGSWGGVSTTCAVGSVLLSWVCLAFRQMLCLGVSCVILLQTWQCYSCVWQPSASPAKCSSSYLACHMFLLLAWRTT